MSRLFILLLAASALTGCSYSTFYVSNTGLVASPSFPAGVALSSQKSLLAKHRVLGRVAVMSWGNGDSARRDLQEEAAKIGANAVIDLRLEKMFMRTAASGLAVLVTE